MIDIIIKYFFIYALCLYICFHLLNHKHNSAFLYVIVLCYSFFLSFVTFFLRLFSPALTNILPAILLWISVGIYLSNPKLVFFTTILSLTISYGAYFICNLFILFLLSPFHDFLLTNFRIIILVLTGVSEFFLVTFLLKIKRFRQGMPFLSSTRLINIGTGACICLLSLLTYIQLTNHYQLWFVLLITFFIIMFNILLIFWWQAQLTKSYLRKLQLLELESLRKELEETSREMEHLKKQNEELGRLIHKDNKLIPAMETAVIDFLSASNQKENNALGQSLVSQLRELSGSRREILDEVSAARSHHFATGVPALDTMLTYFDRRAEARKMEFTVNVTPDLKTYVPSRISSDDITHLLADLLENAIIAVTPCTSRKIRLQIYPYRKWFVIELSDTGIPFQAKSLLQFGIQQLTTHKDSGGSGIGLMDVWKLKKKYHASIHITEYPDSFPFSKRITFLLDHRNQYLIRTWRCEELKAESRRTDLCILPPGNEISSSS